MANQHPLNDKKTINAWALFDWANSAYALVISTAVFPIYFIKYTPDIITLGPMTFTNSALYTFAVTFSYIIIASLSPLLSGIADFTGRRKFFLSMFTLIGSLSCISLYFFAGIPQLWLGTSSFILATIGFAGSLVFYDSYLPLIASEDQYNRVSAKGFIYGYIGSVILLITILTMIQRPEWFYITEWWSVKDGQLASRVGFVLVGLWWLGFSQYTFRNLPKDVYQKFTGNMISQGYREIKNAYRKVKKETNLKRFLLAFFCYSAGVQTLIYLATVFAEKELDFSTGELIGIVLLLQLVAIGGAYLFSAIGNKKGNKFSLLLMITIWFLICVAAYFTHTKGVFYIIAISVGMVMGGIQALSRASYSMLLPEKDHDSTSYFSFYDVVYKLSIVGGTLLFGIVDNLTHSMRNSVLVLAVLFMLGFYFMTRTEINPKSKTV